VANRVGCFTLHGTPAATEFDYSLSTKPPQFCLRFFALCESELAFLSHPFDFTFPGFQDALFIG